MRLADDGPRGRRACRRGAVPQTAGHPELDPSTAARVASRPAVGEDDLIAMHRLLEGWTGDVRSSSATTAAGGPGDRPGAGRPAARVRPRERGGARPDPRLLRGPLGLRPTPSRSPGTSTGTSSRASRRTSTCPTSSCTSSSRRSSRSWCAEEPQAAPAARAVSGHPDQAVLRAGLPAAAAQVRTARAPRRAERHHGPVDAAAAHRRRTLQCRPPRSLRHRRAGPLAGDELEPVPILSPAAREGRGRRRGKRRRRPATAAVMGGAPESSSIPERNPPDHCPGQHASAGGAIIDPNPARPRRHCRPTHEPTSTSSTTSARSSSAKRTSPPRSRTSAAGSARTTRAATSRSSRCSRGRCRSWRT